MSSRSSDTRTSILRASRDLFEDQGYFGAGLEAVAQKAGVSRQAIYLHFASKSELLTALHRHIYETDVEPALARHPIWTAPTSLDALDACVAASVEIVSKVWRIHEVLVTARRHHPEVDETLHPREDERYAEFVKLGRWLKQEDHLPPAMRVATFADIVWGLTSIGTFVNLVIERGWPVGRFERWVRKTILLQLGLAPASTSRHDGSSHIANPSSSS
jgi:AcrR family transcriptional regulator